MRPAPQRLDSLPRAASPFTSPAPQVRPVRPADAPAMQAYLAGLDGESRWLRFHGGIDPAAPALLRHLTGADGRRHHGFVAACALDDGDLIVGEAQCVLLADGTAAEFAISVAAGQRGGGLAARLMAVVIEAATSAGAPTLHGEVRAGNARMAAFMARQGFRLDAGADTEPGVVRHVRTLAAAATPAAVDRALPAAWRTDWMTGWRRLRAWRPLAWR